MTAAEKLAKVLTEKKMTCATAEKATEVYMFLPVT